MRTKGQNRKVVSWTSQPPPVLKFAGSRQQHWTHTLLLDCGHTVTKKSLRHARFHYSDCPDLDCKRNRPNEIQG